MTIATHPHAADRLARLKRRQLNDSNPAGVQQEIQCEIGRIGAALGPVEMSLRLVGVDDSLYRTPADRNARSRVAGQVAGHSYEQFGTRCDSLNAIASREEPIALADSSIRNRRN